MIYYKIIFIQLTTYNLNDSMIIVYLLLFI